MKNLSYFFTRFAELLNVGIFTVEGGKVSGFHEHTENNPICQSARLREALMDGAANQKEPYIYADAYMVYYVCIKKENVFYLAGPMALSHLNKSELHQYYKSYGLAAEEEKRIQRFTLPELLDVVEVLANMVLNAEFEDNDLIYANHIAIVTKEQEDREHALFAVREDEEELYHHTYQEERKLLDSVREGNVEAALRYNRSMDGYIGKLSRKELNHWKNLVVVAITLCTRAAIEGGLSPSTAYQVSDFYIQKSDGGSDIVQIIKYRDHAVEELTQRVRKKKERRISGYIERCEDYVNKNYKKKLCLPEIADDLGISPAYLSRLFKKETGVRFQDFVVDVRLEHAANLLKYSDETIPNIAEYVHFPSQSYMGKVFKEKYHITPRKYRELYRPAEFSIDTK